MNLRCPTARGCWMLLVMSALGPPACSSDGPQEARPAWGECPSCGTAGGGGSGTAPDGAAGAAQGGTGGGPGIGGSAGADDAGAPGQDAESPPGPSTATFRTLLTLQYLSAAAQGVTAASATAGDAERFTVTDVNGGELDDGDAIQLASSAGTFLSADGSGALGADAISAGESETFVVTRLDGPGTVGSGDRIALRLASGDNYVSAIDGGGGEVRADAPWAREWETFRVYLDGDSPPSAAAARQRVLDYIASIAGSKTIAGQHNKYNSDPAGSTDWIVSHTGKAPGLWSADFGFGADAVANRGKMIQEAKRQWGQGALVQIMYHNCIPTRDELCGWDDVGGANPQHLSDDQWDELVTDGTTLNGAWKARLDTLSPFFEELRVAGVAPLFRPLHEMNQGVFWWGGRGGPNGTRKLFQITHDYLVQEKGFDHIIWVWNVQDFGSLPSDVQTYDPGQGYYDLASLDIYDGGYEDWKYDAIRGAAGSKPFGIGECATVPSSEQLAAQQDWFFFMLWPDFLQDNEGAGRLMPLYNSANVITRDQMPGWP